MESNPDKVCRLLKGMAVKRDVPLSELTSFRIGGPAAILLRPHNADEIATAIQACSQFSVPYCVLGNGTNILAPDSGFAGLVIRLDTPVTQPVFVETRAACSAGTSLSVLARESVNYGLMGLESLSGIPGTVGGACAMNAGAYGAEMRHFVKRVRVLQNGRVSDVDVKRSDFGNRTSRFCAPECVVLSVSLELAPDDGGAKERMLDYTKQRKSKQPLSFPSAGSVFKRPKGRFAGALIENAGLKGASVGDAEVSMLHAGFIINRGHATEHDVLALISLIQQRVFDESGVVLEREVKLLSEVCGPCIC